MANPSSADSRSSLQKLYSINVTMEVTNPIFLVWGRANLPSSAAGFLGRRRWRYPNKFSPSVTTIEPGYIGEWWGRGRRFGITRDRVYWFAVANAPQGLKADDEHRLVKDMFRDCTDPVPEILDTTPATAVIVTTSSTGRPPKQGPAAASD